MNSDFMDSLDSLAVATFTNIGTKTDKSGDLQRAEVYYKRAVRAAETIYGEFHGETGLVLLRLCAFYRRNGRYEDAIALETRIADIAGLYLEDQLN